MSQGNAATRPKSAISRVETRGAPRGKLNSGNDLWAPRGSLRIMVACRVGILRGLVPRTAPPFLLSLHETNQLHQPSQTEAKCAPTPL